MAAFVGDGLCFFRGGNDGVDWVESRDAGEAIVEHLATLSGLFAFDGASAYGVDRF